MEAFGAVILRTESWLSCRAHLIAWGWNMETFGAVILRT